MAHGMLVFRSLDEAARAGFQIYDRTSTGYLVRATIGGRWQLALVEAYA
jgi:hypothetical protein